MSDTTAKLNTKLREVESKINLSHHQLSQRLDIVQELLINVLSIVTSYCPVCHEKLTIKEIPGLIDEKGEQKKDSKIFCEKCNRVLY